MYMCDNRVVIFPAQLASDYQHDDFQTKTSWTYLCTQPRNIMLQGLKRMHVVHAPKIHIEPE